MSDFTFVVTNTIPEEALHILRSCANTVITPINEVMNRKELLDVIVDADALFCTLCDRIDAELIEKGSKLSVIATMSVGYNHIDVEMCRKRDIKLGFTPNVLNNATAELCVALLLATAHSLVNKHSKISKYVANSVIGIVGLGRIGLQIVKNIMPFGPTKILYYNPNSRPEEATALGVEFRAFDDLLAQSDFVICCCALNKNTRHLFNLEAFNKMKRDSVFINISRGETVDQNGLHIALSQGIIGAAGLDVTSPEPININSPLLKLNNCVVLPHIGSATQFARTQMALLTARNIVCAMKNECMPSPVL